MEDKNHKGLFERFKPLCLSAKAKEKKELDGVIERLKGKVIGFTYTENTYGYEANEIYAGEKVENIVAKEDIDTLRGLYDFLNQRHSSVIREKMRLDEWRPKTRYDSDGKRWEVRNLPSRYEHNLASTMVEELVRMEIERGRIPETSTLYKLFEDALPDKEF